MAQITFRMAQPKDTALILHFIRGLAVYEKMEDQVIATEELLTEWLFEKQKAEVVIGEAEGKPVGFALFFHNFSTFLGRAGIYLEDLFVEPSERGKGYGKALLAILGATRGKAVFDVWKNKKDAVHIVLYGLLGMSGCQFAYFTAVQYSNAGTATVLQYIGPALILLWLCLRQHRLPSAREAVGLCLALAGTFLIATHGDPTSLALSPQGLFWGLCAAVFVAVYTLQPAHLLSKHDSATVVGWGMLIGGLMQMIVLRPWTISVKVDGEVIWYMALIVIVGTILTFTMYLDGIKRIGPARGSMISAVEPVSAALFAVCWLGTPITKVDLIGFACILAMILLLSKPQKVKD